MGSRSRHPHEKDSSNSKQDTPRHDERTLLESLNFHVACSLILFPERKLVTFEMDGDSPQSIDLPNDMIYTESDSEIELDESRSPSPPRYPPSIDQLRLSVNS
ncbi:hypothetical protein TNCV_1574841 [Trichonephila clavipes]|nr:hypothetical protein TNCV_1574841 [Trichonephila clavipes]